MGGDRSGDRGYAKVFMEMERFMEENFEVSCDEQRVYGHLGVCVDLRNKYIDRSHQRGTGSAGRATGYRYCDGVFSVRTSSGWVAPAPCRDDYFRDAKFIIDLACDGQAASLCHRRLKNLRYGFMMYRNTFADKEKKEQTTCSEADYYKVVKIDTHVHNSACMNSKHLLQFLKGKLSTSPEEVVHQDGTRRYTLSQVFECLNIGRKNLLIDMLDTHAHTDSFHRFDRFNKKYNPYGEPVLREIFLKYDNFMKGKFLSEITKEVLCMQEELKYHYSEHRLSVYGRSEDEWATLSAWVVDNGLFSTHVKWVIQVPRMFSAIRGHDVPDFGKMLRNVFAPLFKATEDAEHNPRLARFLQQVVGFDSVDDESIGGMSMPWRLPVPDRYTLASNPPYSYYLYYMYANVASLNLLRKSKGLNVFSVRPHSGEAGDPNNLVYAFLVSQSISHGLNLRKLPVVQYLYYVCQVGISMSPLSNNALFLRLRKSPFFDFFAKGLCVCLSTDDPLQFHFTREPLSEEYSMATQFWKLSSCDQCEIARNSVLISNFEACRKREWIGDSYDMPSAAGNDIAKTNVPDIRLRFREMALFRELFLIGRSVSDIFRKE